MKRSDTNKLVATPHTLSEERQIEILRHLPKEVKDVVGKHSKLWNYDKLETLELLSQVIKNHFVPINILAEIQQMIDSLEIGTLFVHEGNRLNTTEPLTELGLFVNKLEQLIQKAHPTLKTRNCK